MTRTSKTPRQRAEEALDTAGRAVKRLATKKTDLQKDLDEVTRQHDAAVVRRDYLATNPDLQPNPSSTSTGDPA